jgi:hypothetical protein
MVSRRDENTQVFDQDLGDDLFLDVAGRGVHGEVLAVLLVLAFPYELRVQRRVATVAKLRWAGRLFVE